MNNFSHEKIIIYHKQCPIAICKPDHLGLMGVYLEDLFLGYPVGTHVDIGFFKHKYKDAEEECVSMIINKTDFTGTGLRLKNFDSDSVFKWRNLLTSNADSLATTIRIY